MGKSDKLLELLSSTPDPVTHATDVLAHKLSVVGGIVSATSTLTVRANDIASDSSSVFIATDLVAEANRGILLNTLIATVDAVSLVAGSIIINEADGLTVKSVVAKDGKVEITAGNTMLVHTVQTIEDNAGNNIVLKSGNDLQVDYVEAGFAKGALKANATVTLDAAGRISELSSYDNYAVDVAAYTITLKGTNSGVVVINDPTDHGSGDDLEVAFTKTGGASAGVITGSTTMTVGGLPSSFCGDYILIAPGKPAGNVSMSVCGTLTVVELPTSTDYTTNLSAGKDLVIVSKLYGSTITLSAASGLTLGSQVKATNLTLTAGDDLTLNSWVDTLRVTMTGSGDLTVSETDSLHVYSVVMNGGDVTIVANGDVTIDNITGTASSVTITAKSGNIRIGNLASAGAVTLNAPLGSITATMLEADTLDLVAKGDITITEKDDVIVNSVVQGNLASSFTLNAAGNITLNDDISATGSATIMLNAGNDGTGSLAINQALTAVNGAITLKAGSAITLSEQADITSTAGAVTINAGMRSYDTTVTIFSTAPAIPTVDTLVTTDATPVLSGMANAVGNILTVTVNGTTYRLGTDSQLTYDSSTFAWRLAIPATLAAGTYAVTASVNNGTTITDDTSTNELIIYTAASATPTINTLTTSDTTPTITGTASVESGQFLEVTVKNLATQVAVSYNDGEGALSYDRASRIWSLVIASSESLMADTTYAITATVGTNSVTDHDALHIIAIQSARPTVNTLNTTVTRPALSGTVTLYSGELLMVSVGSAEYVVGDGKLFYEPATNSWSLDLSGLAEPMSVGTWSVIAQVKDGAGNIVATDASSNELVILPSVGISAPTVNSLTTCSGTPILSGTASTLAGQTLTVTVNGKSYTAGDGSLSFEPATSFWSLAIPVADSLAVGTYSVTATVGGVSDITSNELDVRTKTSVSPTVNTLNTIETTPTLSGTATLYSGEILTVTVGASEYTTDNGLSYNAATRVWTLPVMTDLALGAYTVTVTAGSSTTTVGGALVISSVATTYAIPVINTLVTYDVTPVLTGTATLYAGDSLAVRVENSTYTLGAEAALSYNVSQQTWSLAIPAESSLLAGAYSITVNVTDAAGTVVSTATKANALEITAVPTRVNLLTTNSTAPTITGTATVLSGETLKVTLNGTTYTAGDSSLSYNTASRTWELVPSSVLTADASYDVIAEVYNGTTLVSADSSALELVIYTLTPLVPTVNALMTGDSRPTITGTALVGTGEALMVTVNSKSYRVDDGNLAYHTGSGIWSLTLPVADRLAAGSYTVKADIIDGASGAVLLSDANAGNELVIFTTAPAVPTVNTLTTKVMRPVLSGTATVLPGEMFTVKVGATLYTLGDSGNALSYDAVTRIWTLATTTALKEDSYAVEARLGTMVYNITDAVTIYTVPVAVPVVNTLITTQVMPIITGSATVLYGETLTVQVVKNSGGYDVSYTLGDGHLTYDASQQTWSLVIPAALATGTYSVTATVVTNGVGADTSSNEVDIIASGSESAVTASYIKPTVLAVAVNTIVTTNAKPIITGTATVMYGEILMVKVGGETYTLGTDVALVYTASSRSWSLAIPETDKLAAGSYDVTVTVGSTTAATLHALHIYEVATSSAPTVNPLTTSDPAPTLSGTATLYYNQSFKVTVDTTDYTTSDVLVYDAATGIWSLTLPDTGIGIHTVIATAGGVSSPVTSLVITAAVLPTVNTLVTSSLTPTLSGTAVVMNGETLSVTITNSVTSTTTTYTATDGLIYYSMSGVWSLVIPDDKLTADTSYDVNVEVREGSTVVASTTSANAVVTYCVPSVVAPTVNTLTTMLATPIISGMAIVYNGQQLTVTVNGVDYTSLDGLMYNAVALSWSLQLPELVVGSYDVHMVVTDAGNNRISEVVSLNALEISVATTPVLPTVNTLTTTDSAPILTGTATLFSGEKLTVTIDGATYDSSTANSRLTWDAATRIWTLDLSGATALATAQYTVVAEVRNAATGVVLRGDTTADELTIIVPSTTTAPTINTITTNDITPTITGTATVMEGQVLTVRVNSVDYTVAANNLTYSVATRVWSLTTPVLSAGSYTVTAQITGGALVTVANAVVIYTAPPAVATTAAVATSSPTPTLTGSVTVGSNESLTVTLNGKVYTVGDGHLSYSSGRWSLVPEILPAGSYTATARVAPTTSTLTMTGETVINSHGGLIDIDAGGTITLGKLRTTNSSDLVVTSIGGAVLDAGDSPTDVIASGAKLVINAKYGVGTGTYGALETQIASLDITNTISGNIAIQEADTLTITNVAQGGSGNVSINTLDGFITVNGSGITAKTGSVILYAGGNSSSFTLDGYIHTTGASGSVVAITTDNGNITLSKGIEVAGTGDITLLSPQGSIVNNPVAVGWLQKSSLYSTATNSYTGSNFSPEIDWAMNNGRFSVDQATGKIIVANATASEERSHLSNGTVLRAAEGPYIQTTGGDLTIKAKGTIGDAVNGFTYSPLSLVIDAVGLTVSSDDRSEVAIIATASVAIKSDTFGSGSKGGATAVSNLSGGQIIASAVDAAGDNISIVSNTISIDAPIRSAGAVLDIAPVDRGRVIVLGYDTNQMDGTAATILTTASLANIQEGFQQVVIGSSSGYNIFQIGDKTEQSVNETLTFNNNLVLENPSLGGEIWIFDNLNLTGGSSLTVHGSGHTTTITDSIVTTSGNQYYDDSLVIAGNVDINATGDIQVGTSSSHTLNGNSVAPKDNLVLNAGGNITVSGVVGGADSLASLSIVNKGADGRVGTGDDLAGAVNVTFYNAVTVDGDVTIYASGVVTFKDTLHLTSGNLTIKGATQIVFGEGVTVDGSGNIFLEGDEVDFMTGTTSVVGHGILTIRPTKAAMGIELVDPPTQDSALLNLTMDEVQAIGTGFTEIIIGRQGVDMHAEHTAGVVRIGANSVAQQYTFYNKLSVYGGSILITDYDSPTTTLILKGDLTLDAYGNIEFDNQVKLYDSTEKVSRDLRVYSETGNIWQRDDTNNYDLQSREPIYAKNLITTSQSGTTLGWIDVDTITATNTGSGAINMNIVAAGGDVSVLKMAQTSEGTLDTEAITLTAENGNITLSSANVTAYNGETLVASGVSVAKNGTITIRAYDTGTDKTLVVNNTLTVNGTNGDITIAADGSLSTSALIRNFGAGAINVTSTNSSVSQSADVISAGGFIAFTSGTSITMASDKQTIAGATGAVSYTAGTDIALSIIDAGGTVTLTATAGAITDNLTGETDVDLNIKGDSTALVLSAAKGIGTSANDIDTKIATLKAINTGTISSGIFIQERDSLTVSVDGITVSGTDGSVVLDILDGSLLVSGAITSTGTVGNILLQTAESSGEGTTTNADITLNAVMTSTGNISLYSKDTIIQNAGGDITLSSTGKTLDLLADAAITMVDGALSTTTSGNIRYQAAAGSVTIGQIEAGTTGKVAIIASLGILDLAVDTSTVDITAGDLLLTAGTAIALSDNHLETSVANFSTWSKSGDTFVAESDSISVTGVSVTVNRVGVSGSATATTADTQQGMVSTGNLVLATSNGSLTTIASTGGISATGNILLSTGETGLEIAVNADLSVNASVTSSGGNITLLSKDSVLQNHVDADISTTTLGKTIDLLADAAITMVDGAVSTTNAGAIRYATATATAGTITVGVLDARTSADRSDNVLTSQASWGSVSILSGTSILDNSETTVDVYARELRLSAATAIGAGTNHLETEVVQTSGRSGLSGLFVTEATAITAGRTAAITVNRVGSNGSILAETTDAQQDDMVSTGALVLVTTAGSITTSATGGLVSATGNMLLQAGGGTSDITLGSAVTDNTTGGNISLNAGQDILQNATILASTSSKTIDLVAGRNITQAQNVAATSTEGNILLLAGTGITIETLTAGSGCVSVTATNGSIIDGDTAGDSEVDITSAGLLLKAGTGSGAGANALETTVTTLTALSGNGGLFVTETNDLTINTLTIQANRVDVTGAATATVYGAQEDLSVTGGDLVLTTINGFITTTALTGDISATGNILLQSGESTEGTIADITLNASVISSGGNITLLSKESVLQNHINADISTTTAGKTIDVLADAAITMVDGAVSLTNAGAIRYATATATAGAITVGVLDARTVADRSDNVLTSQASWGSVSILSGTSILDNSETTVDVYSRELRLSAATAIGVGTNHLETEVAQTSGRSGLSGFFVTEATAVTVGRTTAITVNRVGSNGSTLTETTDAQQDDLVSTGALVLVTTAGSITSSATGGLVTATGNMLLQAGGTSSDLILGAAVTDNAMGGNISLNAGQDILQNATILASSSSKTIDLVAGRNITQAQNVATTSTNGNILLLAGTTVTLETLSAGTGNISVTATVGSIVDGDADGDTEADILATGLLLKAGTGIGTSVNALETTVTTLTASAGNGGFFVTETNDLTINILTIQANRIAVTGTEAVTAYAAQEDLSVTNGNLVLMTLNGFITTTASMGDISATGNILLSTGETGIEAAINADLTLNASVTSSSGNITLISKESVLQNHVDADISTITAGKTIDVLADAAITMIDGAVSLTNAGALRYATATATAGAITVGMLDARTSADRSDNVLTSQASWGLVSILSGTSILDNSETTVDVYARELRLSAATAIGAGTNHLETEVAQTSGRSGLSGLFITESTAVTVGQTTAITVNRVGSNGSTLTETTDAQQDDMVSTGALVLVTTAGSIETSATGGMVSATGNMLLQAGGTTSDLILGAAVTDNATGGNISLNAGQDILQNATILASTSGKTIDLVAGRNITMADGTSTTSTAGNILLYAGTGNITIDTLAAGTGSVSITAAATSSSSVGTIIDLDGTSAEEIEVDIIASGLILKAGNGIGTGSNHIESTVTTLTASAGAGGLFVTESDGVRVTTLTISVNRVATDATVPASASGTATVTLEDLKSTGAGAVVLEVKAGDLDVNEGTSLSVGVQSATGNIRLQSVTGNINLNAGVLSSGGNVSLLAGSTMNQAGAGDVTTTGTGSIDVEAGTIIMANGAVAQTAGGNIRYAATGDITVGLIDARIPVDRLDRVLTNQTLWGAVSIIAGGSILDNIETTTDIYAKELHLNAATGVGAGNNFLETEISTISARAGTSGLFVTEATDVTIGQTQAITVSRVETNGTTLTATTDVLQNDFVSTGTLVLMTTSGSITTLSTGAVTATGNMLLQAVGTTSDIILGAAVTDNVTVVGGNISLNAGREILQNANIQASTSAMTIDLQAIGNITMADGTSTTSTAGTIRLLTAGDITIGVLDARSGSDRSGNVLTNQSGWGLVSVFSSAGSIVDNTAASEDSIVDIYASSLRLNAIASGKSIGQGGNHIETEVQKLSAAAGTNGLFVTESTAVTIDKLSVVPVNRVGSNAGTSTQQDAAQEDLTSGGNLVLVTLNGSLTLNAGTAGTSGVSASSTGNILLQAMGAGTDITANADIASGSGNISVLAAQNVTFTGTADIRTMSSTTTDGSIDLWAGTGSITQSATSLFQTTGSTGTIRLLAATDVTVGDIESATGTVSITATAGSITDADALIAGANDNDQDITASGLRLNAGTAIGASVNHLESTVTTLSARTGNGSIYLLEADGVTVDNVGLSVNRIASDATVSTGSSTDALQSDIRTIGGNGNIVLRTTNGSIMLNDGTATDDDTAISANGSGNILIQTLGAGTDITVNADIITLNTAGTAKGTGNISVLAAQSITFTGTSEILTTSSATTDGSIDLWAGTGSITQSATSLFQTTGSTGTIRLLAATDVTVGDIESAIGTVSITATAGSITDADALIAGANDNDQDITASGLRLNAGTAIGASVNHLESTVKTLSARAGNGSIYLLEADGVTVDNVGLSVNRVASDATVSAGSSTDAIQSDIRTTGGNGNIVLRTTNGSIMLNDGTATDDDTAISANGSGSILIDANGTGSAIIIGADLKSTTGHITIQAADGITLGNGVDITTSAPGMISLDAEGGALTMDGTSTITATGSTLRLSGMGEVTLGNLAASTVSILSNGGSIFNASGSTMNVTATNLRLHAWNAIGTAERHLTTNVDDMSADPYTQGAGIYITERDSITITSVGAVVLLFTGEALTTTITDLAQSGLVTGKNGNILLVTEHGSITLDDGADGDGIAISANGTGSIQLEANGTGSGIVVNADIVSGSGSITVFAVDDVEQHADISSSGTTVHVESSGGSIMMDQGVQTVDSNGTIVYRACKDVFLSLLYSEHGEVQLYAETGSITTSTTGLNVQSEKVLFKAHVNVGLRTISPLNLSVDSLAVEAETGMMGLVNDGTVTVTSLEGITGLRAHDGISLESLKGDILVVANIDTQGRADALFDFPSGALKGDDMYFDDAGTFMRVNFRQIQYLWNEEPVNLIPVSLELKRDMHHDIFERNGQNAIAAASRSEQFRAVAESERNQQQYHSERGAYADIKDGYLFFSWGEVPEAESYLLVLERDKMEFASRWLEETAWQPFEKLPEGIYEWSVYCWATDGLKLVSGPMHFRI